jgi:hypothetical protein
VLQARTVFSISCKGAHFLRNKKLLTLIGKCIAFCKEDALMAISLRLNSSLERELSKQAHLLGVPKSKLIINLISDFLEKKSKRLSPRELGEKAFGREGSGHINLSIDRKAILKEKLYAKKIVIDSGLF